MLVRFQGRFVVIAEYQMFQWVLLGFAFLEQTELQYLRRLRELLISEELRRNFALVAHLQTLHS